MPTKGKLTEQQRRFCEAYVVGHAERRPDWWAAWQAGCCNIRPDVEPSRKQIKYLSSRASKLLNGRDFPHVPPYIARLQEQEQERQAQARERQIAESLTRPTLVAGGRERGGQAQAHEYQVTKLLGSTFIARGRESEKAANRHTWLAALELADLGPHRHEIERMIDRETKGNPGRRARAEALERLFGDTQARTHLVRPKRD